MTRLSLKNSPIELQWPYTAKDGDIPSRKADASYLYVYSGHLEYMFLHDVAPAKDYKH